MSHLLLFVGSMLAIPSSAEASIYDEQQGTRSTAMGGAHRGMGSSNDTIYLNPAGIALTQRYNIDVQYGYSPVDRLNRMSVSIVDSKTSPVAGALAYTHDRGNPAELDANLHRLYLGAGYKLGQGISLGLLGRSVRGSFKEGGVERDVKLMTGDVGLSLGLGTGFGVGLALHNIVRTDEPLLTPMRAAGGLAFGSGGLVLAADFVRAVGEEARDNEPWAYHLGAEYALSAELALRGGYRREPAEPAAGRAKDVGTASGGLGYRTQGGGLDATFSQSIDDREHWAAMLGMSLEM